MRQRGLIAAVLTAIAAALPLSAAQADPVNAKVVMHAPLRVLDPVLTNAYITRNHGYLVYDTLHDDSVELERKLRAAEVDVAAKVYPGTAHSFLEAVSIADVAGEAFDDTARWLHARA